MGAASSFFHSPDRIKFRLFTWYEKLENFAPPIGNSISAYQGLRDQRFRKKQMSLSYCHYMGVSSFMAGMKNLRISYHLQNQKKRICQLFLRLMRNQKVLPLPSSLSTAIAPSCISTIVLHIARPRPVPPFCLASETSTC